VARIDTRETISRGHAGSGVIVTNDKIKGVLFRAFDVVMDTYGSHFLPLQASEEVPGISTA